MGPRRSPRHSLHHSPHRSLRHSRGVALVTQTTRIAGAKIRIATSARRAMDGQGRDALAIARPITPDARERIVTL